MLYSIDSTSARNYTYTIDFVTDLLPLNGHYTILTIVDIFTKFTRLFPYYMGDEALSAAEADYLLFRIVVYLLGLPYIILNDRGP